MIFKQHVFIYNKNVNTNQHSEGKMSDNPTAEKATSSAKTSANLGGVAVIVSVFSSLIAIGLGIAAIITAIKVLNDNPNKPSASQAKLAIAAAIIAFLIPLIMGVLIRTTQH
jgi:uncharacterized membrane protein YkgB